jgi:restriction system protein
VPVPDFQSLMLPVLQEVIAGPIPSKDLRARIAQQLRLTEQDLAELLPSGRQTTFTNRVAWANVFLQRAGLIRIVRRGVYEATEAGKVVASQAPARIDNAFLQQFPSFVEWRQRSESTRADGTGDQPLPPPVNTTPTNPEEQLERSYKELTAAVEAELLERLQATTPSHFENLIIDLLVAMNYGGGRSEMAKALGRSGDDGVDGVVREDKLGLDVVYMQAKRYAPDNIVGVGAVRDFVGALEGHRATKGVFVTTSRFARSAPEYIERVSKRVALIDGPELARLMVEHGVGVRVKTTYVIKEVADDDLVE